MFIELKSHGSVRKSSSKPNEKPRWLGDTAEYLFAINCRLPKEIMSHFSSALRRAYYDDRIVVRDLRAAGVFVMATHGRIRQ